MNPNMIQTFDSRKDLIEYLAGEFPLAFQRNPSVSTIVGGRRAAEQQLERISPRQYGLDRNYLDGAVTRLSPYIRHGIVSLAEVRDAALRLASPSDAEKFITELGYRDYFQRVYRDIGDGIWQDREPIKSGLHAHHYTADMPADVLNSKTGLKCIDEFSQEIQQTGYLHNHVRMWLSAYIIHWRRIRWQTGAAWFLEHLLDGDPASNNLSWQWIASTFSQKPYIFNRENLEKYTQGRYCRSCERYGNCDFEGAYSELEARLFEPHGTPDNHQHLSASPAKSSGKDFPKHPIAWIHGDNLNPNSQALNHNSTSPAIWVWDDELLEKWRISFKRIVFIYESLLELPVIIRRGQVAEQVIAFAAKHHADGVITNESPSPRFQHICEALEQNTAVSIVSERPFLKQEMEFDLKRFSRYWRNAKPLAFD